MPARVQFKGWRDARRRLNRMVKLMRANMDEADHANALSLRDAMREVIMQGDAQIMPNAPLTVEYKGSSRPLTDNGDLAHSIDQRRIPSVGYAVGVFHGGEGSEGVDTATIAKVLARGAVIVPKNAQSLAIPVHKEAARARRQYGSTRQIPGLIHPKGTNILGKPKGSGDDIEVWFVLTKRVVIPPRPFDEIAYRRELPAIRKRYKAAGEAAIRGKRYRPY